MPYDESNRPTPEHFPDAVRLGVTRRDKGIDLVKTCCTTWGFFSPGVFATVHFCELKKGHDKKTKPQPLPHRCHCGFAWEAVPS